MVIEPPCDDEIERQRVIVDAEARLFGCERARVQVGRFELRDRLGIGGLGVVYSAFDPELDREVAIKLLRRDRSLGDDSDRGRLLREARAMARLSHPNVVAVHEVGVHDGRVFLAMERVVGRTARCWLSDDKPDWKATIAMYMQAGRGLAAAHANGVIHRDFKPDNLLVGDDGRARVTDFGLAAAPDETDSGDGTPAYMAPEQRARATITVAADQYAFALSLLEALFGARDVRTRPRGSPVPRRVWNALQRALSESPQARFPSLDALLGNLDAPPRRRGLKIVGWTIVSIVLAAALVGAVIQFWMFKGWMNASRAAHGSASH